MISTNALTKVEKERINLRVLPGFKIVLKRRHYQNSEEKNADN